MPDTDDLLRDARRLLADWNGDFTAPGDVATADLIQKISDHLGEPDWTPDA